MKKFLLLNFFMLLSVASVFAQETILFSPSAPITYGDALREITIQISDGDAASVNEIRIFSNESPTTALLTATSGSTPMLETTTNGAPPFQSTSVSVTFTVAANSADDAVKDMADIVFSNNTFSLLVQFIDNVNTVLITQTTIGANLPVGIKSFGGAVKEESALLNWSTDWEVNNDFYTVERSFDGRSFVKLDVVAGAGTTEEITDYSYVDEDLLRVATASTVYYRVKQTDFDGQYSYTEVIALDIKDQTALDITNVLISGDNLDLSFTSPNNNATEVVVVDLTGRIVAQTEVAAAVGANSAQLDLSGYTGLFIVRLINNQTQTVRKIVK